MKQEAQQLILGNEEVFLLPEKALFWPAQKALLVADLHIGKAAHFRKNGLPVSSASVFRDLERLSALIYQWNCHSVYILGDLFHSETNSEHALLENFIFEHSPVGFHLVTGNHDRHSIEDSQTLPIHIHPESLIVEGFRLCHDEDLLPDSHHYTISGHLHPGIGVKGKARQHIHLPCLWVKAQSAVLPAFGSLNGLYCINLEKDQHAWVIAGPKLLRVDA